MAALSRRRFGAPAPSPSLRASRARRQSARALMESLESRTLFSATVGITGNSAAISAGDISPTRTDFTDYAQIYTGGTVTRTYTITNTGDATLSFAGLTPVTFSGVNALDFQIVAQPLADLAPGNSTTITVEFVPDVAGVRTAQLNLATNDPANATYSFAIQGTALDALNVQGSSGTMLVSTTQAGTGNTMQWGNRINVLYTGYLLNGTVFDASSLHGNVPFGLTLGYSSVIDGWHYGLFGTKVGEHRTLFIPPAMGYGASGQGSIPPNSVLIFETEIVSATGPFLVVSGNGNTVAAGDTSPSATDDTDLGAVATNASVTHAFTITPTGPGTLQFLGDPNWVTLGGTNANQFSITQPVINQAGTAAEFTVTYTPTGAGNHTATLTIPTNDPINRNFAFTVGGSSLPEIHGTYANSLSIPGALSVGNTFNVPVMVTNSGLAALSGTVNIKVKASLDATWDDSDIDLGSVSNVNFNLAVNGSSTSNVTATIPGALTLPLGQYYLVTKIEPVTALDSNLANNTITQVAAGLNIVAGPDLTASVGSISTTPLSETNTVNVSVTLTNSGGNTATGSVTVRIKASTDAIWDDSDVDLGSQSFVSINLAKDASTLANITATIPGIGTLPAGQYFIVAKIEAAGTADITLTNNTDAAFSADLNVFAIGPDLTVSLGALTPVYTTYIPGDAIKIPITITNIGNRTATASAATPVYIELRASTDGLFDSGDTLLLPPIKITKPILSSGSLTVVASFKLPLTLSSGDLTLVAKVDTSAIADTLPANNTTDADLTPAEFPVDTIFGNVGRKSAVPLTFFDGDGTKITLKLSGPGAGQLTFDGTHYSITLTGATAATSLTIATAKSKTLGDNGRFTLKNFAADALNALAAKTTDLVGDATITGSTKTLTLGTIDGGGGSTLAIGGAVATFTVAGNLANAEITVPAITKLAITGDFLNARLRLTQAFNPLTKSLATFTATRITHSEIRSFNNLGTITAKTITDSLVFAGVSDLVSTLPTAVDFNNADPLLLPTIAAINIAGISTAPLAAVLVNSQIAAGRILAAKLPTRLTALPALNALDPAFGFTTRAAAVTKYTGPPSSLNFFSGIDSLT